MTLDLHKLGAGLLASGPLLLQFGGSKVTWWIGLACTVAGPIFMAVRGSKQPTKGSK